MIFVYGHLTSRTAAVSGVLVDHGVVYAAGGLVTGRDSVVVALDAVSGEPRWVREGFAEDCVNGLDIVFPCGGLLMRHGQLWLRTLSNVLVRLDAATGKIVLPAGETALARVDSAEDGADIGIFADRWVVQGGRPWFWEQWEYYVRRLTGYSWTELNAQNSQLSPIYVLSTSGVTPAWDARTVLCIPTLERGDAAGRIDVAQDIARPQHVDGLVCRWLRWTGGLGCRKNDAVSPAGAARFRPTASP